MPDDKIKGDGASVDAAERRVKHHEGKLREAVKHYEDDLRKLSEEDDDVCACTGCDYHLPDCGGTCG